MSAPFKPKHDYVVLTATSVGEQKTASGIILADNANIEESPVEEVIAVGPDASVKVGDRVLFKWHLFDERLIKGTRYLVGKEEGIIGTI